MCYKCVFLGACMLKACTFTCTCMYPYLISTCIYMQLPIDKCLLLETAFVSGNLSSLHLVKLDYNHLRELPESIGK